MIYTAKSITGQRSNNEDSYILKEYGPYLLAAVADGMGGRKAGETASRLAVSTIAEELSENMLKNDVEGTVDRAIREANSTIMRYSTEDEQYSGMGSTVVAAVCTASEVHIANIGDSRLYFIHDNRILQVTKDHSFVAMLIDEGILTKEQAMYHPQKNLLVKALGTEWSVLPDHFTINWEQGDYLLLCSDGLCGVLNDQQILSCFREGAALFEIVNSLIEFSSNELSTDNITAIVIRNLEESI